MLSAILLSVTVINVMLGVMKLTGVKLSIVAPREWPSQNKLAFSAPQIANVIFNGIYQGSLNKGERSVQLAS